VRVQGSSDEGVPLPSRLREPDVQGGEAEFGEWETEAEVKAKAKGSSEFEVEVEGGDKFKAERGNKVEEQEAKVEVKAAGGDEADV
jgi:hypothetical protein